jgi:hypothetical protein
LEELTEQDTQVFQGLLLQHQELKVAYLRAAEKEGWESRGIGNEQNNRNTVHFLEHSVSQKKRQGELAQALNLIRRQASRSGDRNEKGIRRACALLRELYILAPGIHELWFQDSNYRVRADNIIRGRLGMKTLLTAKEKGRRTVMRGSMTYLLKNALLLENQYRHAGVARLLDQPPEPHPFRAGAEISSTYRPERYPDIFSLLEDNLLPQLLRTVHGLLKNERYQTLTDGKLATRKKWLYYASCSINEGPFFVPRQEGLPSELSIIDLEHPRSSLQRKLEVLDYSASKDRLPLENMRKAVDRSRDRRRP